MKKIAIIGLVTAILLFLVIIIWGGFNPEHTKAKYVLAITALMSVLWITEAIPLAVTALLPVVLFPVTGVVNAKEISSAYVNDVIFLFMGGFMIALAMERWNLHRRIALKIMKNVGTKPVSIIIGFMLTTAFLSMWISNTATTMMLLPIALSIIKEFSSAMNKKSIKNFSISVLLVIAYSASIGGIATLVGTAPNLVLIKTLEISFPNMREISFGQWFVFGLPLSLAMLVVTWLVIHILYIRKIKLTSNISVNYISEEYRKLGKFSFEEKFMTFVFVLFAVLLIFRTDIKIGSFIIKGWSNILSEPSYIKDGTISMLIAVLLFLVPSRNKKGTSILNWETANKLPWNIIILFGGGFALAKAFISSGLSVDIGESMKNVFFANKYLNIILISLIVVFLTEVTSNTATTQILLPIIGAIAVSTNVHPIVYMLPATISASMAFMLPVATPPNAIIFGSGKITIKQMSRIGIILNFVSVILISIFVWFIGIPLLK